MSDQTPLTINIAVTTRAAMNASTPRFGVWTYHHVLPVRLYFMIAWTMLQVCKRTDCWKSTHSAGKEALKSMCQNRHNQNTVMRFFDERDDAPAPAAIADVAKLCASPPFGGFGGPNPAQRSDDPHDGVEPFAPASTTKVWFNCLAEMGFLLKDAFALQGMPQPNTNVAQTRTVAEWCHYVEGFAKLISVAATAPEAAFEPSDWSITGGHPWSIVRDRPVVAGDPNINIALRRRGAQATYLPPTATANQLHAAMRLVRLDDQLKFPPPPMRP